MIFDIGANLIYHLLWIQICAPFCGMLRGANWLRDLPWRVVSGLHHLSCVGLRRVAVAITVGKERLLARWKVEWETHVSILGQKIPRAAVMGGVFTLAVAITVLVYAVVSGRKNKDDSGPSDEVVHTEECLEVGSDDCITECRFKQGEYGEEITHRCSAARSGNLYPSLVCPVPKVQLQAGLTEWFSDPRRRALLNMSLFATSLVSFGNLKFF
jgi:hypothetical protein